MDETVYWKVLDHNRNSFATVGFLPSEFVTHYPIKEWVSAKVGGLFVFNNMESARSFACTSSPLYEKRVLARCFVKPMDIQIEEHVLMQSCNYQIMLDFWNGGYKDKTFCKTYADKIITDTVIVKEVFCLE